MKFGTPAISLATCAMLLLMAPAARADNITAYGWITTEAVVDTGAPNFGPGGTAAALALPNCHNGSGPCNTSNYDVKFTMGGSLFFDASDADIADWLASSVFPIDNLAYSDPTTVPYAPMDATIWLFLGVGGVTGTAANPQPFIIDHDDGVTLIVNGQVVISSPDDAFDLAHSLNVGYYTNGATSMAQFSLAYAECCGGPARLITELPTPEPGAVILLGTAMLFLCRTVRHRVTRRNP